MSAGIFTSNYTILAKRTEQSEETESVVTGAVSGINLIDNAWELPPNQVLKADNLFLDQGSLAVRWGKIALLANTHSTEISWAIYYYANQAEIDLASGQSGTVIAADYSLYIVYAADQRIWKWKEGWTDPVNIPITDGNGDPVLFDTPNMRLERAGRYIYIVDGSPDGNLYRCDLNSGTVTIGMNAPTLPPLVQLTDQELFETNLANWWSFDGQDSPIAQTAPGYGQDPQFTTGNNWILLGPPPESSGHVPSVYANWAQFQDPPRGQQIGTAITNAPLSGNPNLYPSRFHILFTFVKNDPRNTCGIDVTVTAYSDAGGTAQIDARTIGYAPPVTTGTQGDGIDSYQGFTFDDIFDFSGVASSIPILSYRITILGQSQNTGNHFNYWLLGNGIQCFPISTQIRLFDNVAGSGVIVYPIESGGAVPISSAGSGSDSTLGSIGSAGPFVPSFPPTPSDLGNTLDLQDTSLTFSLAAEVGSGSGSDGFGYDFRGIEVVYFRLAGAASWTQIVNGVVTGLAFSLSIFNPRTGNWTLATNGTTIPVDLSVVACDLTTIDQTELAFVSEIKLTFLNNITFDSPFSALQIGPLFEAGNLSQDVLDPTIKFAPYFWAFTEDDVILVPDMVESNGSPNSQQLVATLTQAMALITLPEGTPFNGLTNYYGIYRAGGTQDATPRLLAYVPVDSSFGYGEDSNDPSGRDNPYIAWNHVDKVVLDNTPDSLLDLAPLIPTTHFPAPKGLQGMAVWQGRLWLFKNQLVVGSSLIESNNPSALYFDFVNLQTDPLLSTEGVAFTVGTPDESDPVIGLLSFGTPVGAANAFGGELAIRKKQSFWVLNGDNATGFVLTEQRYNAGIGSVAVRGATVKDFFSIIFVGPDRFHTFPIVLGRGTRAKVIDTDALTHPILPLLYPRGRNGYAPIASDQLYGVALAYHDGYIFAAYPEPGATSGGNTILYVYSFQSGGWTPWLNMPFSHLVPVPPDSNAGQLYYMYTGGTDGQLYRLDPQATEDTLTGGGTSAIPIEMVKPFGGEGAQTKLVKAVRAHADITTNEHVTIIVGNGDNNYVNKFGPIAWPNGRYKPALECDTGIEGQYLTVGVTANCTTPLRINAITLDVQLEGEQR